MYGDTDRDAPHISAADEAVRVAHPDSAHPYLLIEGIVAAAVAAEADAVHPGYGFLSENPEFVEACAAAGLCFVGPTASAMRALGDKAAAKEIALTCDVPTVPSWDIDSVPAGAYPVLVKAVAGGGGRGMRVVHAASELDDAVASARSEAINAFGSDEVIVEKLVVGARHVEVQILADNHGKIVTIGDRDCSLQRRYQKIVEEAPAPNLSAETRSNLARYAASIAAAAHYSNAGTAEFLVDINGDAYFLELNARLQVEHPVTEVAFDIDLVSWQLAIAAGDALTLEQEDIVPVRHAIEARLCAEDPVTMFPSGGAIRALSLPTAPNVRIDHCFRENQPVSLQFDAMLGKVIASAPTRTEAITTLTDALRNCTISGTTMNIPLLLHVTALPAFRNATHDIATVGEHLLHETDVEPDPDLVRHARWIWRNRQGTTTPFSGTAIGPSSGNETGDGAAITGVVRAGDDLWFCHQGFSYCVAFDHIVQNAATSDGNDDGGSHAAITAPMPGTVLSTLEAGTHVHTGEPIVVLEAMKMENAIAAPFDGTVLSVSCTVGDLVGKGTVLAEVGR